MHHPTDSIADTMTFGTKALAGMRNSSIDPPQGLDPTHCTMSGHSTTELSGLLLTSMFNHV